MADPNDVRGTKMARQELNKRGVDTTHTDIRVTHGVLYIKGQVRAHKDSSITDLKSEMETIARVLRQRAEIKDVVLDCMYRN